MTVDIDGTIRYTSDIDPETTPQGEFLSFQRDSEKMHHSEE